jgi:hypothetical protein
MKKILLTGTLFLSALIGHSQVVVNGVSPAAIQGSYEFTTTAGLTASATSVGPWGGTVSAVTIQDTLKIVDDGTAADSLGCNVLVNDLTSKIAVIYRGSCSFYSKVLNAQNAGALAVIIINNAAGMINPSSAPANNNALITIPIVTISQADGALLRAQMDLGDVVMLIGNLTGYYPNNLGIYKDNAKSARSYATPAPTAQAINEHIVPLGVYLFNRGSQDVPDASVTVNIYYNGTSIHNETSTPALLAAGDTVNVTFADFSQAVNPLGVYTVAYTTNMASTDENSLDDSLAINYEITNNKYSMAPLDVNGLPIATTHTTTGTAGATAFTACILYQNANANRLVAENITFSASDTASIDQEEFTIEVYQWDDIFDPAAAAYADNFQSLNEVGNAIYNMNGNLQSTMVTVPFTAPIALEVDLKYLFCISPTTKPTIKLGFNSAIDYGLNNYTFSESAHPFEVQVGTTINWYAGFTSNLVPAFAITMSEPAAVGIFANTAIEGSAYPNPANDELNFSLKAEGNATITATDVSGKVVMTNSISLVNGKSKLNINSLTTGMYIFNVVLENGNSTQFNVVKK